MAASIEPARNTTARMIAFLGAVGLHVRVVAGASGVVPGVAIACGELLIDPTASAGDLLHEAGHLAILPKRIRTRADGYLAVGNDPLGEPEAIAWAWAAGQAIGLTADEIIEARPDAYQNAPNDVRAALYLCVHPGVHGLVAAGFTSTTGAGGWPIYPRLRVWLRD